MISNIPNLQGVLLSGMTSLRDDLSQGNKRLRLRVTLLLRTGATFVFHSSVISTAFARVSEIIGISEF